LAEGAGRVVPEVFGFLKKLSKEDWTASLFFSLHVSLKLTNMEKFEYSYKPEHFSIYLVGINLIRR
jgi:hypothetical protein